MHKVAEGIADYLKGKLGVKIMRKKIGLIMSVGIMAMIVCSCGNSEQTTEAGGQAIDINTIKTYSFPTEYKADGENITVDMTVNAPEKAYFLEGTVEFIKPDYEELAKALMDELQTSYDVEINDDGSGILISQEQVDDYYKAFCRWGNNGLELSSYPYLLTGACVCAETKDPGYNLPLYETKKSFSFATEEEALTAVMDMLENNGIMLGDEIQVDSYYLDYETLQQEEAHYDMDGNRQEERYRTDWSEADDAYCFYIHQTYCGLRDYHTGDFWAGRAENGNAQVVVGYNAEGIAGLMLNEIGTYRMSEKEVELLDMDTVVDALITHYENILDDATYEVTSATLCCDYRSAGKAMVKKMIPVWAFQVKETSADGIQSSYEIRVNAATGEFL